MRVRHPVVVHWQQQPSPAGHWHAGVAAGPRAPPVRARRTDGQARDAEPVAERQRAGRRQVRPGLHDARARKRVGVQRALDQRVEQALLAQLARARACGAGGFLVA